MLFERLLVFDDGTRRAAAWNMALDEALLEWSEEPALRFYGWERPSLSFGYFGKYEDVAAERATRELVRRWTGGGIVFHGDDLTYSLVTPARDPAFRAGPREIYAQLHGAIQEALRAEGRAAQLAPVAAPKISDACFANPVRDDVLLEGRKVAGAAQRRTRRGFLQQGSIQVAGLATDFRARFSRALARELVPSAFPNALLARARELAEEKYRTDAWLRRC